MKKSRITSHYKRLTNGKLKRLREDELHEATTKPHDWEKEEIARDEKERKRELNHFRKLKTKFIINNIYQESSVEFYRRGTDSYEFEIGFKTEEEVEKKDSVKCDLGHFHIEPVVTTFSYECVTMSREAARELANWILEKLGTMKD